MRDEDRQELKRRRRWEREVLRDGLRGGHLREHPDSAWLPGEAPLKVARTLLKAGGCEAERRPLTGLRRDEGFAALIDVVPARDPVTAATDRAQEQGADALLLGTHHFAFGGSPRQLRPARERFDGPVIMGCLASDEADIAIAAALEADGVVADVRLVDDLPALFAAARCYAMPVLVQADDRATLDAARAAGSTAIVLRRPDEPDERAADRSFRLLQGLPDTLCVVVAGARTLKTALALRRSGADAALVPAGLLDLDIEALAPPDEEEPSFAPDARLMEALGAMGVADPFLFTQSSSGLLVLTGSGPPTAPREPDDPRTCPLDVLRVRRPRGFRV
jgi:indole-3-glycerol phosphate synthase